jgi:hypothetical protein
MTSLEIANKIIGIVDWQLDTKDIVSIVSLLGTYKSTILTEYVSKIDIPTYAGDFPYENE